MTRPPTPPQPSPQALLTIQNAFERFSATITPQERNDFASTGLKDVRDAAIQIEKELAARRSLRNMRRLQPFFQGLDHYSKVVDVLCNGTPFLAWIWAPIKLMLQVSADYIGAFEKLIEAYGKIGNALPRFDRLGAALKHDHSFQAVLAFVYADILEFHRRAYRFVRRKSWKLFFNSMWAHFDSRFNSILERLANHSELVDKEAAAVNIAEAVEGRRSDALRWDKQDDEWRATKLHAVMCWLGCDGTPPEDQPDKMMKDCLPGSCDWIVAHSHINSWLEDTQTNPLVWLHGKPGAGKSVICSSLIRAAESRSINILFYFCTYLDATHDGSLLMLRSLVAQTIQKDPDLSIYVHDDWVSSYPISSRRALLDLFPKLLQSLNPVRLVIDGIDEWSQKEQKLVLDDLLHFLCTASSPSTCKILVSSRDEPSIARKLRRKTIDLAVISLNQEESSMHHAIARFTEKRLAENEDSLKELDPSGSIVAEVGRMLVEKSNGMFLWVRLVLDSLDFAYSSKDLREAIARLPSDLSELYKRILGRICNPSETQRFEKVVRLLMWICHSRRPLNKFELIYSVALSPSTTILHDDEVPVIRILELCKPLIEERHDGSIAFIHFSVQEYLVSDSCNLFREIEANHDLSFACTTLLRSGLQLLDPGTTAKDRSIRIGNGHFRLLPYALENWTEHFLLYALNGGDIDKSHELVKHLSTMHSMHNKLRKMISGPLVRSESTTLPEDLDERLQSVSRLPIKWLIRNVLHLRNLLKREGFDAGNDVEEYSLLHDRTLFSKLSIEFQKSVLWLLSQDSVNDLAPEKLDSFKGSYASTAFQCRYPSCSNWTNGFANAELRGQHETLHLRRIYCKVPTCQYSRVGFKKKSGLERHVRIDHSQVDKVLMPAKLRNGRHERGQQIQINSPESHPLENTENNPLISPVPVSSLEEFDTAERIPSLPLSEPETVVLEESSPKIAVARNASRARVDRFGGTHFARECERGDLEAVQAAYEEAPEELDQVDFADVAPLQKAALHGWADVVEFLLKKGCRTDCQTFDWDTPLIDAAENGHVEVVKLLLNEGHVNPHHQNKKGQRALDVLDYDDEDAEDIEKELRAAMKRTLDTLHENQARTNGKSVPRLLYNEYNTETLIEKAGDGDIKAVGELINSNVKPNNACGVAAARGGHYDILSILIASGMNANPSPLTHRETPMLVAIGRGHLNIIRLLLEQDKFDPTRRNREGKTYWEISEEMQGPNWEQERDMLKDACSEYRKNDSQTPVSRKSKYAPNPFREDSSSPASPQSDLERLNHITSKSTSETHLKSRGMESEEELAERAVKRRRRVVYDDSESEYGEHEVE